MNGNDLYNLKPYGAKISFTDHAPKPPARFNKKLSAWERTNGAGYFTKTDCFRIDGVDRKSFGLQLSRGPILVVTNHFSVDTPLEYAVEPRPTGTVIAYSEFEGNYEVKYVWPGENEAYYWAQKNRYDIANCGYKYWTVAEGDVLVDWNPAAVTV